MTTIGIAGDLPAIKAVTPSLPGTGTCGIAGLIPREHAASLCGIAGLDTTGVRSLPATMAVAGHSTRDITADATGALLPGRPTERTHLGDRVAGTAGRAASWLVTYYFALCPDGQGGMRWRAGREEIFAPDRRRYPVVLDSGGFGRELTCTAPNWAQAMDTYHGAIETAQPDGYMSFDYPMDRAASMATLRETMRTFPGDVGTRLWPVFSARWAYSAQALATFERLPGWASRSLLEFIPRTSTQRDLRDSTIEAQARLAIAQALIVASDPDFEWMVNTFGRVAIGGLVKGPIPRLTRHLYAHVLADLFPGVQLWLLGQASGTVVNGLGLLGDLHRVSCDGSWWIKDATAHAWAYVHRGWITTHQMGQGRDTAGRLINESFLTTREMMAANLRSLLAAYAGDLSWPRQVPLPIDPRDRDVMAAVRAIVRQEATQLGLQLEEPCPTC